MTDHEAHEVYKELSAALNDLSRDLVKGLVALRAVASDNKSDIARTEQRFDNALTKMQEKIDRLVRAEGATAEALKTLQQARATEQAADKAVRVEHTKGRWAFWVAIAGGGAGLLTTVAQLIAGALGWGGH